MKCLKRNQTGFYYALFVNTELGRDEFGNESGEPRVIYSDPVFMSANISPATGGSQVEQFGKDLKYDKVIVLDDMNCPIDENTVLFVDKPPARDKYGNLLFDYIVVKMAKSLNSISIAIRKVNVS